MIGPKKLECYITQGLQHTSLLTPFINYEENVLLLIQLQRLKGKLQAHLGFRWSAPDPVL
jgi:hypothetical protein